MLLRAAHSQLEQLRWEAPHQRLHLPMQSPQGKHRPLRRPQLNPLSPEPSQVLPVPFSGMLETQLCSIETMHEIAISVDLGLAGDAGRLVQPLVF